MPVPLLAVAGAGAAGKVIGGIIGGRKKRRAAEKLKRRMEQRRKEIEEAGQKHLENVRGMYSGAFETLANIPELDIDTSQVDNFFSTVKREADRSYGRAAGEEIARDNVRQETADSLARVSNAGGSVADVLGFLGDAEQRERRSMREIDYQAINEREDRITRNMDRLSQAALKKADFYNAKEMAEQQDQVQRGLRMTDFQTSAGMNVANIENQNAMNLIEGGDAIAQASANVDMVKANNVSNTFNAIGDGLMNFASGGLGNGMELSNLAS